MPTFDAGTIDATLDLDRSPFSKSIERARQQGQRFEKRKLTVPLILDRSKWDKTLAAVRQQRDRFEKHGMTVDLSLNKGDWTKDLTNVRQQIKRLETNNIDIKVDIDGMGQLSTLQAALATMPNRHTITIDVDYHGAMDKLLTIKMALEVLNQNASTTYRVDTSAALVSLAALKQRIDGLDRGPIRVGPVVGGGTSGVGGGGVGGAGGRTGSPGPSGTYGQLMQGQLLQSRALMSSIAAIVPLVSSALGVAAGAAVGLAAGLTAAAGVGAIGILPIVGAAIKAKNALDEQKDAQDAVTDAEKALAEADSAEDRAAAAKDLADAQAELKRVTESLSPEIIKFSEAQDRLTSSWDSFVESLQNPTFNLMAGGFDLLSNNLGRFTPLAEAGLGVFQTALDGIGAWFEGPESEAMLNFFSTTGVESLTSFLNMGGNLILFFGRLFDAFSPLATEIMTGLEDMSAGWADWAGELKDSEGLLTFLDWVRERGGEFLDMAGSLWDALVNLGVALDPIAEVLLGVFTSIFDWIAGLDPGVLGAVIAGVLAATVAFGALGAAIALVTIVMNANPITLIVMAIAGLVAGLVYAYNHIEGFRRVVDTVWNAIKVGALWMWNGLKQVWEWLKIGWEAVSSVFQWVWENTLKPVFTAIGAVFTWVWETILQPIFNTLGVVFSALGATISWVVNSVIGPVFELIGAIIAYVWNSVVSPIFTFWSSAFAALGNGISTVWNATISPVIDWMGDAFSWLWTNFISPMFDAVNIGWKAMGDGLKWVYDNTIAPVIGWFQDIIEGLSGAFDVGVNAIKVAWDNMSEIVKAPIRFVVDTVINDALIDNFNKIADFFGTSTIPRLELPSGFDTPSTSGGGGGGGRPAQIYAAGGVTPGWSPGRDIHHFTSPTAGNLSLSGGEAIMVPEWTRAVGGPAAVAKMNRDARHGGQAFAGGGVWNKITDFASDVSTTVGNFASGAIDFVTDPLGYLKASVDSVMGGLADNKFAQMVGAAPGKILSMAGDKIKSMFSAGDSAAVSGAALSGIAAGLDGWAVPSFGPLTSKFGARWGSFHNGIDIAGGGPTYAVANGTVARTGWNVGYGNTGLGILVDHGGGLQTYYGHNPVGGIKVSPGQVVTAGQHLGYQGATGNVTGIHLHHSIFQNGRAIDPLPFLAARGVSIGSRDAGGPLYEGWNMMYNGTGENELVLTGDDIRHTKADMDELRAMLVTSLTRRESPLVGGDLVLQANKDEDPTSQFERVLFQLMNGGV